MFSCCCACCSAASPASCSCYGGRRKSARLRSTRTKRPGPWPGLRDPCAASTSACERNALADLNDRPVDELDRALAIPALVGHGRFQFRARILQKRERSIHARLRSERVTDSQARNSQNADQQSLLRDKTRHAFLLP